MSSLSTIHPIRENERIQSLDVLRGFAILGILIMNIQSFSMIGQAYLNPTAFGDFNGVNQWVWIAGHLFADSKFMSIFSMLFGASILMISQKSEEKTGKSAGIHYRRNFWLLVIGLIHAYVFWYGDILTPYACCAFFIYFFRKLSIRKLWIIGLILFSIGSLTYLFTGFSIPMIPETEVASIKQGWAPDQRLIDLEVHAYIGTFSEQMAQRIKSANMMHTTVFFMLYLWRISGLMLIGMAFYKSGFIQGKSSSKTYLTTFITCIGLGASLVAMGLIKNFEADWQFEYSMFLGSQFNYWGSLLMAIAYMSLVMFIVNRGILITLANRLASVGRMALSNYLMQTFICTLLFYGHGLGFFGQVERGMQFLVVISIWCLQLYIFPIWLKHFQFGPFEWLWRTATYGKVQAWRNK